jgi:pyruvate/2-oxoglutarate dehydrogenase complex dihydrolipoamide acyltransferase (E2) component
MSKRLRLCTAMLGGALGMGFAAGPAKAQSQEKQQHVVTSDELKQQVARPADTRQANEDAVRHLLSSDAGRQALKSANVDYQRVDKAIGQLNDEEVAKLADRSRQAESDFAAGAISAKTLAYLILAIVIIVVIVVIARAV